MVTSTMLQLVQGPWRSLSTIISTANYGTDGCDTYVTLSVVIKVPDNHFTPFNLNVWVHLGKLNLCPYLAGQRVTFDFLTKLSRDSPSVPAIHFPLFSIALHATDTFTLGR